MTSRTLRAWMLLLPKHVDDADDVEQCRGPDEKNSLLVGIGPEVAIGLQSHQECRLDGNKHHDEVGGLDVGQVVIAGAWLVR